MKTALVLSTYPSKKPFHGGQVRLSQLCNSYKKTGYEVLSISIYEPEAYGQDELSQSDIPFNGPAKYKKYQGEYIPLINDFLSGIYSSKDEIAWTTLVNQIRGKKLSVIHFEQPWLLPLVKRIRMVPEGKSSFVIFGSQNIEFELKKKILSYYNVKKSKILRNLLHEVRELEIQSATTSDLTLTVTEDDDCWFKKNIPLVNTLLIPNGVRKIQYSETDIERVSRLINARKYITYIASAYPPNFEGFFKLIGDSLACIPPDGKLVIAGSVTEHIQTYLMNSSHKFLNQSRLVLLGKIDVEMLDALLHSTHAIILPITDGGGSNLKTAEALISQNYIIGSPESFRGYRKFISFEGVTLAADRRAFRSSIRTCFTLPKLQRDSEEKNLTNQLLWDTILTPFQQRLSESFS